MTRTMLALTMTALLSPALQAADIPDGPAVKFPPRPEYLDQVEYAKLKAGFESGRGLDAELSAGYGPELHRFLLSPEFDGYLRASGSEGVEAIERDIRAGLALYWELRASSAAAEASLIPVALFVPAYQVPELVEREAPLLAPGDLELAERVLAMRAELEAAIGRAFPGQVFKDAKHVSEEEHVAKAVAVCRELREKSGGARGAR